LAVEHRIRFESFSRPLPYVSSEPVGASNGARGEHTLDEEPTMNSALKIIASLIFAAFAASASAADVLTGKNGMTLYTFDQDSHGKSACAGTCLARWPAAQVGDASGKEFGAITREDGAKQLSYQGKPLYYYAGDKKPGDTAGDNVANAWHVVPTQKGTTSKPSGYDYGKSRRY
jgi:predicted lipoprotein with Yx(FWY)xxD motif